VDANLEARPDDPAPGGTRPIELVRAVYRAFEDGDHTTIRRCFAGELSWRQAASVVPAAGEEVVGADAVIDRVLRPLEDEWATFIDTAAFAAATGRPAVDAG
jgi:ketosteroid isomerase-like protein